MKTYSDEEFKNWLIDRGYDYETHQDDIVLWNEYRTIPSKYTNEELMDDCWEFSRETLDFEKVENHCRKQTEIDKEYSHWKLTNWRSFDLNATDMDLYYQFMLQRNNNAL